MNRMNRELRISLTISGATSRAEMAVAGDFDEVEIARFDRAAQVITDDVTSLTVDLTGTTVIDSAALGSLIRLRRALDEVGCELVVLVARPFQRTVMEVSGLFEHLGVRLTGGLVDDDDR